MILVADSCSIKTNWLLAHPIYGKLDFKSQGINPLFQNEREIERIITGLEISNDFVSQVKEIHFFGAGCFSPDRRETLCNVLSKKFINAFVNVENDLLGVAYSCLASNAGIVALLDVNSNAAYYDGYELYDAKYGIGYILGDDASEIHIGKRILSDFLYGNLPNDLSSDFAHEYKITKESVIKSTYQKQTTQNYLYLFADFVKNNASHPYCQQMLSDVFQHFIDLTIKTIPDYTLKKCSFIGSVANSYANLLQQICVRNRIKVENITNRSIEHLLEYISHAQTTCEID